MTRPRFWIHVTVNGQPVDGDPNELFATWDGLELDDVIGISVRRGDEPVPLTVSYGVLGDYTRGQWELALRIAGELNAQQAVA